MQARGDAPEPARRRGSRPAEVFGVALLLGLTSFGGPIAHLGYFHREYVDRRGWLSDEAYLDLVALCHLLPGPASSQVGIGIGLLRAGWPGAVAAWLGFTLPSAVMLTVFALLTADVDLGGHGWVHGLKLAAVAVVGAAIVAMWRTLATDWPRRIIALTAAVAALLVPTAALQAAIILAGALAGRWLLGALAAGRTHVVASPVGRGAGAAAAGLLLVLLIGLPVAAWVTGSVAVGIVSSFVRAGSLVFGGGHVVLPLLSESFVTPGWIGADAFLAGYGAAQAVPGPLFTVAAHVGASLGPEPNGVVGAVVGTVAIFLPSFLLMAAAMPYWTRLRQWERVRASLAGASAAVIGLLLAALVDPLWTSSVASAMDAALVAAAFGGLVWLRVSAWAVVACLATAGLLTSIVAG